MGGEKIETPAPHVFCMVAGEPSGDLLGAFLIKAMKDVFPKARFVGIGGPLMQDQGLESLFSIEDLTVIGITEVLPKAFKVLKRVQEIAHYVYEKKPAALITIDAPAFSFRLGRALKKLQNTDKNPIPHIHYVAPTVWAWRPKRAEKISKFLTHLLTLFSFEPAYFLKEGLFTTFVGHPILEGGYDLGDAKNFRKKYKIKQTKPLLSLLPGSRRGEVEKHLPIFLEALEILSLEMEFDVVLPTLRYLRPVVEKILEKNTRRFSVYVLEGEAEKKDAFAASSVALAASGTVALELSAANLPMVIAYKTSWITACIVRHMIQVSHVSMPNILLNASVVPELLQEKCKPDFLAEALGILLKNKGQRDAQKKAFQKVKDMISPEGSVFPSMVAAQTIKDIIKNKEKGELQ